MYTKKKGRPKYVISKDQIELWTLDSPLKIAEILGMSESTVKRHRLSYNISRKNATITDDELDEFVLILTDNL